MRFSLALIFLTLAIGCGGDDGPSDPGGNNPPVDNPPTASITSAPSSGTVGEPVSISYSASDDNELDIVSVGWGVLDTPVEIIQVSGTTATGQRSHTYSEAGTYTVTVQATDTSLKTDSDSRQIEISEPANQAPTASLTVDPPAGTAPLDVQIDLTCTDPDGSISTYELDADGDGTFEMSQASAISVMETYGAGTVTVQGKCTDNDGAVSDVVSETVTVTTEQNEAPTATLTVDPTSGTAPLDVQIDLACSDPDGSVALYELDADGDGTFEVSQVNPISVTETYGAGTVTVSGRCTDNEDTVSITVSRAIIVTGGTVIGGTVENNETDSGRQANVRIYDPNQNLLAEEITGSDGVFGPVTVEPRSDYIVQAVLWDGGGQAGYVRTVRRTQSSPDIGNLLVRAVPFDGLSSVGVSPEQFQSHMCELVFAGRDPGALYRWNLDEFVGVYVAESNPNKYPDGTSRGRFTSEEQDSVVTWIGRPGLAGEFIEGRQINVVEGSDGDPSPPYAVRRDGEIQGARGWITVLPDSNLVLDGILHAGRGGCSKEEAVGFHCNYGSVSVHTDFVNWFLVTHEMGHAFRLWHAFTLSNKSIMRGQPSDYDICTKGYPGINGHANHVDVPFIDRKTSRLQYEPTFDLGSAFGDILALDFLTP